MIIMIIAELSGRCRQSPIVLGGEGQSLGTKDTLSIGPLETHWSHVFINPVSYIYIYIYIRAYCISFCLHFWEVTKDTTCFINFIEKTKEKNRTFLKRNQPLLYRNLKNHVLLPTKKEHHGKDLPIPRAEVFLLHGFHCSRSCFPWLICQVTRTTL